MASHWTEEKKEKVKELLALGMIPSEIARSMHMTKGQISGVMSRSGLKSRTKIKSNEDRGTKAKFFHFRPHSNVPIVRENLTHIDLDDGMIEPSRITILELEDHHCRWPMDDNTYCGHDRVYNSYCSHHYHRSRRPPS